MKHRPGVTLIEVLITIFIMGIGMLALLALFPLGAVSMAQALKDDRVTSAAINADSLALAWDIRHDATVSSGFTTGLPATYAGPSYPVYVDPAYVLLGSNNLGSIPRK